VRVCLCVCVCVRERERGGGCLCTLLITVLNFLLLNFAFLLIYSGFVGEKYLNPLHMVNSLLNVVRHRRVKQYQLSGFVMDKG
jgi:hypothetical protein